MNCSITGAIDCADGESAAIKGHSFDVYRLSENSQHQWLDESNKLGSMKVWFELSKNDKPGLETERRQGFIWYKLTGNFSSIRLGDVFKLNDNCVAPGKLIVEDHADYEYVGFSYAQSRDGAKQPFGARLNTTVQVLRPRAEVSDDGYHNPTGEGAADAVILINGRFELSDNCADAVNIPAGLSAMRPYGAPALTDVPSQNRKSLYGCYIPPLKGFSVVEGDRIIEASGARYVVLVSHYQATGAIGYQLTLEREVSNNYG